VSLISEFGTVLKATYSSRRKLLPQIALALAYPAAAALGISLAVGNPPIAPFWPASGIVLGALLVGGLELWPGLLLGITITILLSGLPLSQALPLASVAFLEPILAATLLRRFRQFDDSLSRTRDVVLFALAGVMVSPALFAALVTWAIGEDIHRGVVWWLSDGISILVFAPALLLFRRREAFSFTLAQAAEGAFLAATVLVICLYSATEKPILLMACFPILILSALRIGQRGTILILMLICVTTAYVKSLLGASAGFETIIQTQLYLAHLSVSGLLLATLVPTERLAELHARQTELKARLVSVFTQTPTIMVVTKTPDFQIEFVTPLAQELVRGRLVPGSPLFGCVPELESQGFLDLAKQAFQEGKAISVREKALIQGGDIRFLDLTFHPTRDHQGELSGLLLLAADVTQRVEASSAIERSEKKFRLISESIPQMVLNFGPDGVPLYTNRLWTEYTGLSPEETKDQALWPSIIHEDDWKELLAHGEKGLKTGLRTRTECRIRESKSGQFRWHLVDIVPLRNDQGVVQQWFGTMTNIESQKEAEKKERFLSEASELLVESTLNYESTLSNLATIVVPRFAHVCMIDVVEDGGTLRRVAYAYEETAESDQYHRIHRKADLDPEASAGSPHVIRTGKPAIYSVIDDSMLMAKALEGIGPTSVMVVPMTARGKSIGAMTFVLTNNSTHYGREHLQVAMELSHRAALALDNARLFRQAQESIRSRDDLMRMVSHEVLTPLTSLNLQLQMLTRHLDQHPSLALDQERVARWLNTSIRQVRLLGRLGQDLCGISRMAPSDLSPQPQSVDLSQLLLEVIDDLQEEVLASASVLRILRAEPVKVRWDRSRTTQLMTNLISSAVRFGLGKPIDIELFEDHASAFVRVRDRGAGIPQNKIGRALSRVTDNPLSNYNGVGIGLYIVRQIALAHGGTVEIESELDQGTTVTVALPLNGLRKTFASDPGLSRQSQSVSTERKSLDENILS